MKAARRKKAKKARKPATPRPSQPPPAVAATQTELPKDIAADIANLIRKTKSGRPLSKYERDLIKKHSKGSQEPVLSAEPDAEEQPEPAAQANPDCLPETIPATDLAAMVGVSLRRIQQLADAGQIPPGKRGRHPAFETLRALFGYFRKHAGDLKTRALSELVRERAARASEAELDLAERRGDLVPMATAEASVDRACVAVRDALLAMPSSVCAHANPDHPEQARTAFDDWLQGMMRTISGATKE